MFHTIGDQTFEYLYSLPHPAQLIKVQFPESFLQTVRQVLKEEFDAGFIFKGGFKVN